MQQIQRQPAQREVQAVEPLFVSLSSAALTTFAALLQHLRKGFAAASSDYASGTCRNPECGCGGHVFSAHDPLTSLMMRADGVTEGDLRVILKSAAMARGFDSFP
jgi:hypothetical protein